MDVGAAPTRGRRATRRPGSGGRPPPTGRPRFRESPSRAVPDAVPSRPWPAPRAWIRREWRQMRNDVDDGYSLLKRLDESITKVSSTQRLHGNRLHEIQQSVDLAAGRLDRMEDNQRLQAARLRHIGETQAAESETRVHRGDPDPAGRASWGASGRPRPSRASARRIEETQTQQGERLGRVEGRLDGSTATSARRRPPREYGGGAAADPAAVARASGRLISRPTRTAG